MRHTKLMLLGIMLMVLGISMATSIVPAIYSNSNGIGTSVQALRFLPGIEVFLIIIGFVLGLIGYFQKEK